jgi:hypothetical protein
LILFANAGYRLALPENLEKKAHYSGRPPGKRQN